MKKGTMIMTAALAIALGGAVVLAGPESQAAKKKNIKVTVKGSTLTISGKGEMPGKLKVSKSQRNKVKKIVIKKGITSIPVNAFSKYKNVTSATVAASVKTIGGNAFRCPKLKKLTLPGDFKIQYSKGYWIADKVNTVTFNSNLNLERAAAFDANNLVVKKSDPNYKSVNGVIYSKDGKQIVRVPFQRGEVVIEDGCEVFCLQSVLYANENKGGWAEGGCRIRKIVLPSSVKQVESENYFALNQDGLLERSVDGVVSGLQVEIRNKQLDDQSLSQLVYVLQMGIGELMQQMPERISLSGDMYFADENVLFMYKGDQSEIKVPAGITKIGDYAFQKKGKLEELVLPEGLVEIGKRAFYRSSANSVENPSGLQITFPATLRKIGEGAFTGNWISQVMLPDSVEVCGKEAFEACGLTEFTFPRSLKVIPEAMLRGNSLRNIVIPDSIEKIEREAFKWNSITGVRLGKNITEIGDEAFCGNPLEQVTIPGSVVQIGAEAFATGGTACNVVIQGGSEGISGQAFSEFCILTYTKDLEEQKVSAHMISQKISSKKAVTDLMWTKVRGADGYELMVAANARFTKNKKKVLVSGNTTRKTVTLKGKFKRNAKIYTRVRPYTYMDGKKFYGRWSTIID